MDPSSKLRDLMHVLDAPLVDEEDAIEFCDAVDAHFAQGSDPTNAVRTHIARRILEQRIPDYAKVVGARFEQMKVEVAASAGQILREAQGG